MVADIRAQAQRRDRWVNWIVIAVFVVALLLGWFVKAAAENRYVAYSDGAIQVQYPEGWIKLKVEAPAIFRAADKPTGVRTLLAIEQRPLPPNAARPLAVVYQTLTLERGTSWTAYRVLETKEDVAIGGLTGTHVTFAYVETNPDPFRESAPAVMRGEDYLVTRGDQAYVFTVIAPESSYAQAQRYLQDFVRSFK